MDTLIWLVQNFGIATASFFLSFLMVLWLIHRESVSRTDAAKHTNDASTASIKTINDITLLNSKQLIGLQDDYRKLMTLYMETRETLLNERKEAEKFKERFAEAQKDWDQERVRNDQFMAQYGTDKQEWVQERSEMKEEIASLRRQVEELLEQMHLKDNEISDLKGKATKKAS